MTAWRSKDLNRPFEYLGEAITPRSDEVDDWDNYRIQDADIAFIPELNRYAMTCNMMDKDGNPGGKLFGFWSQRRSDPGNRRFLFGQEADTEDEIT